MKTLQSYPLLSTGNATVARLQRALEIEERIAVLKAEQADVLAGWNVGEMPGAASPPTDRRLGKRSAATRAKMAAAQRARWENVKSKKA